MVHGGSLQDDAFDCPTLHNLTQNAQEGYNPPVLYLAASFFPMQLLHGAIPNAIKKDRSPIEKALKKPLKGLKSLKKG